MEYNILSHYLSLLKIKHTKSYVNKKYNEHPYKDSFFGLSMMLDEYGITNEGYHINNTELFSINTPYIVHFKRDFYIVTDLGDFVSIVDKTGKKDKIDRTDFINLSDGNILVAEPDSLSIEPEYEKHIKNNRIKRLKTVIFIVCLLTLCVITAISKDIYKDWGIITLLMANLLGGCVSLLILLKGIQHNNKYADKICSLFHNTNCGSLIFSDAAKVWKDVSWSEIGLSYFQTNALLLLFFPCSVIYIQLSILLSIPFTFWSIWYQYSKAKSWCALCLLIQGDLWIMFITVLITPKPFASFNYQSTRVSHPFPIACF